MKNDSLSKNNESNKTPLNKTCKYALIFLLSLISLFFIVVSSLPMIASSTIGKEKIENYISNQIGGTVSFDSLHFSFWGGQEIKGLKVDDKNGNLLLNLSTASLDASFPEMLFYGIEDNLITFADLNLTVKEASSKSETPLPIILKNVNGNFSLSPLFIKLSGDSSQGDLKGHFDADISLNGMDLNELFDLSNNPETLFLQKTNLKATVKAENFPVQLLDYFLSLQNPKYKPGFLDSLLGSKIDLALNKLETGKNHHLMLELEANSPHMTANIVGELGSDKLFTTKPGTLLFTVDQGLIDYLVKEDFGFMLKKPIDVLIGLDEFNLPFDLKNGEYDLSKLMFKGKVDFQEALLVSKTALPDIALEKMSADIVTHENSDNISLKIHGNALENNRPIKIAFETVFHKSLDLKKHKIPPMLLDLTHIPVALIDHFFGLDQALSKTMGTHADLKIEALVNKDYVDLGLSFESDKISISSMRLKINDDLVMTESPHIKLHLDSDFTAKLLPENAFLSLDAKELLELDFNIEPIRNIHDVLTDLPKSISGEVKMKSISFNIKETKKTIAFQDILIPWEVDTETKGLVLKFSGMSKHSTKPKTGSFSGTAEFFVKDDHHLFDIFLTQVNFAGNKSNLSLKGDIERLFTHDNALNIYGLGLNLDAKIADLPTPLFCRVVCLNKNLHKKIEVLFGDNLNGNLHVEIKALNGVVQANVSGQEGSFALDSQVKDNFLFLNKPFQAQFKVTPRLGKSILHDVFPFLSGVTSSDQPILITVGNENFSFPLKGLDVAKIEIPEASLSLGHVKFDNNGALGNVLSLLTPQNSDLISVWFTPIYFNMHNGIFKLSRVDMLISNQFPIAVWGRVDLIQDKVKMMIGMSGHALKHAFKVKGLDDDYMLQIPFIGKTSSATIDKPTATTKIAALIAQGQGGPKGLVLGAVLSLAGGALSEKRPPKSTTLPLPWAEQLKKPEAAVETGSQDDIAQIDVNPKAIESKRRQDQSLKLDKVVEQKAEMFFDKLFKQKK